jgi:hypothetical protein
MKLGFARDDELAFAVRLLSASGIGRIEIASSNSRAQPLEKR